MSAAMNLNDSLDLKVICVDPPYAEHPCLTYIQTLLCNIDPNGECKEVPIDKFSEFIVMELEITKAPFYGYDRELFEKLAYAIEVFLVKYFEEIKQETKEILDQCVILLKHLAEGKENLDSFPTGYTEVNYETLIVRADIWRRVKDRFRSPNLKCPSCKNEFSQVDFNVIREMYCVKCPKCKQSIVN
jgi:hypothetical protein